MSQLFACRHASSTGGFLLSYKISQDCRHVTALERFFDWNFLDSIILGPTTTAEFAVISHEKDFFLSEYKGQGGNNMY